jgi:hypothetical protein
MQTTTEYEWIDDAFRVNETPYKLWHSFDKEGKPLITALTKDQCISGTRFYLKGLQDGWEDSTVKYDGTVGGKL